MLIVVASDATIRTVNQATLKILGYEEQELIGRPIELIVKNKEEKVLKEEQGLFQRTGLQFLIRKGFVQGIDRFFCAKNGRIIPVLFSGSVMHDENGSIQGIVCMGLDITVRKQAEKT